jgi:hypothetical protein
VEASTSPNPVVRSREWLEQEAWVSGCLMWSSMPREVGRAPTLDARGSEGPASAPLRARCSFGGSSRPTSQWVACHVGDSSSANGASVAFPGRVLDGREVCSGFIVVAEAGRRCPISKPGVLADIRNRI